MAQAAMQETGAHCAAVLHDAKRGEVYVAASERRRTIVPAQIAGFEQAVRIIRDAARAANTIVALGGTAAGAAASALRECGIDALKTEIVAPDALWVARIALLAPEPETVPRPLYLRPPDARLPASPA